MEIARTRMRNSSDEDASEGKEDEIRMVDRGVRTT